MRTPLIAILATCAIATQAFAKVSPISLEQLVQNSDLVVVAKVESVSDRMFGKRYAKAKVTDVWKGTPSDRVEFLASSTWTCDTSKAKTGETALLFLTKGSQARAYAIAHSGRGRMPLRAVGGQSYAIFWTDLRLPKDTPTIDGPEPQWNFIRSVETATLRVLVKEALEKKQKVE